MKQIVVGITGASGAPYARQLLRRLARAEIHVHLVVSALGRRVAADELGLKKFSLADLIGSEPSNITLYPHADTGARIASGSFLTDGMLICPCSSHTLAAIANGLADNLITRAALVTLKERRRLILVPREMPLAHTEIENMLKLSTAGAILCPACPGFYKQPQSIEDLLDFVVGRAMDLLGIQHELNIRWDPDVDSQATGS